MELSWFDDKKNVLLGAGLVVLALIFAVIGLALINSDDYDAPDTSSRSYASPSSSGQGIMMNAYVTTPPTTTPQQADYTILSSCQSRVVGYQNGVAIRECVQSTAYAVPETQPDTRIYVSTYNSYGYPSSRYYPYPRYPYPYPRYYPYPYRYYPYPYYRFGYRWY